MALDKKLREGSTQQLQDERTEEARGVDQPYQKSHMVFQHHMWRRCRSSRKECEVNAAAHLQHPRRIQWPPALH